MKSKMLFIFILIFSHALINAQEKENHESSHESKDTYDERGEFEKGDIFISALFGFDKITKGEENDVELEMSGRLGYLITERVTGGVKISLENEKIEAEGLENEEIQKTLIGLFGRYDFTPHHKFSLFGEVGFDYITSKIEEGETEIEEEGFRVGMSPGITYFLNSHFAIEAFWGALEYRTSKVDGESESTDEIVIGFDFENINFGLAYKF